LFSDSDFSAISPTKESLWIFSYRRPGEGLGIKDKVGVYKAVLAFSYFLFLNGTVASKYQKERTVL